ncbi:MAG: hypothetical protein AB8I08_26610, partial [Sandaracinaceae bacterium]
HEPRQAAPEGPMSEVLLVVESDRMSETERAMHRRRWEPVDRMPGWFRCPFEHGFLDELETIVRADLLAALGETPFSAAFVHTAEPSEVTTAAACARQRQPTPSEGLGAGEAMAGPWRDPGASIPNETLRADVLLGTSPKVAARLSERGWRPVVGAAAVAHAFDLRMFAAVRPRVTADLAYAAHVLGEPEASGVWAMSTHRVVPLASSQRLSPRRALPWD